MITLTNAVELPSSIGGTGTTSYDELVFKQLTFVTSPSSGNARKIYGIVELTSSGSPEAPAKLGNFLVNPGQDHAEIELEEANIPILEVSLTAGQSTAVQGYIDSAQNDLEAGYISVGMVTGTHTPAS